MPRMNDSHPTSTDTGYDTPRDSAPTFSVVEVAAILGLSKDAVRARLHRGTLEGVKVEGAWRVRLPDDVSLSSDDSEHRQPPTPNTTGATSTPTPPQSDVMIAHLEHLEGEVQYLRGRLEEADRQRDQLQQQLADERRRTDTLTALSASVSAPDETQVQTYRATTEATPTGILARLRRWLTGNK